MCWSFANLANNAGAPSKQPYYGSLIGKLVSRSNGVSGDVFAVDEQTLFIKNFNYDGQAPDAYFWSSTSSPLPSADGFIVPDEKGSTKPLERYHNKDVVLRLPEGRTLREIRWLSIWCRQMKLNFGEILVTPSVIIPQPIEIAPLASVGSHQLHSGPITIIDAQTFLVPELVYDPLATSAYFWLARGSKGLVPNGLQLKDENGSASPLRKYNGETVVLSVPDDYTIYDFDYFGIWNADLQLAYGQTVIPQTARVPPSPKMLGIRPENKLNCEILYDDLGFELRWVLDGDDIVMQLVGKIEPGEYMAFGLGKDDARSDMINADAVVTWVDRVTGHVHAVDYFLSSKEQCSALSSSGPYRGSCPDVKFSGGSDSLTLLHGAIINSYTMVTFKRPQLGIDELYDQHVYSDGQQSIIWSIGPLNSRNEISYHRLRTRGDTFIDFARTPQWNCPNPDLNATMTSSSSSSSLQPAPLTVAASQVTTSTVDRPATTNSNNIQQKNKPPTKLAPANDSRPRAPLGNTLRAPSTPSDHHHHQNHNHHQTSTSNDNQTTAVGNNHQRASKLASSGSNWVIPPIVCPQDATFRVQIGPTGAHKGYESITGRPGWGISYYIDGLMIPELVVQRGKSYKFIVEAGNDKTNSAARHPFYITDSADGGFEYKSQEDSANERIYAGVGTKADGQLVPTAEGRLCEWHMSNDTTLPADNYTTFFDYQAVLRLHCGPGSSSVLKFTPDVGTPDLLYYQCYTHRYMGWKIHVVDHCESLGDNSAPANTVSSGRHTGVVNGQSVVKPSEATTGANVAQSGRA
ncbi:Protein Skeletor, isoforms D/E, partial [Fragariocoptes setiger]